MARICLARKFVKWNEPGYCKSSMFRKSLVRKFAQINESEYCETDKTHKSMVRKLAKANKPEHLQNNNDVHSLARKIVSTNTSEYCKTGTVRDSGRKITKEKKYKYNKSNMTCNHEFVNLQSRTNLYIIKQIREVDHGGWTFICGRWRTRRV